MKHSTNVVAAFLAVSGFAAIGSSADHATPKRLPEMDKLVDHLASDDPQERIRAAVELEDCSDSLIPMIRSEASRDDLTPQVKDRLVSIIKRIEPRAKARKRRIDLYKVVDPWVAQQELEAYRKHGHTDPKWDADIETAIKLNGDYYLDPNQANWHSTEDKINAALLRAKKAGCDDPAFWTVLFNFEMRESFGGQYILGTKREALKAARKYGVCPYDRISINSNYVFSRFRGLIEGPSFVRDYPTRDLMEEMCTQFKELAATPGVPKEVLIHAADVAFDGIEEGHYYANTYNRYFPQLEKVAPGDERVTSIKGAYYVRWAWDARGDGTGDTVTDQGWKSFEDRVALAKKTLTEAWNADPTDPRPPTEMLKVELADDGGHDEMETWFKRAMDADPDNMTACEQKLLYLNPKWHGSAEEMLDFGHECLDSENWRGAIPLVLIDVHTQLSESTQGDEYFQDDKVWSDVYTTLSAYLERYPKSALQRSRLAYFACRCHHWDEANAQFEKLGKSADQAPFFGGAVTMQEYQRRAKAAVATDKNKTP